jgi:vitamin B12/bleomycin/antimicrobial peptide transport system ATP-binding/permease protein
MGMKKQKLGEVFKRIWKMAAPYWTKSDEKWGSLGLLIANFAVMILSNFVGVRMVIWNRDWTNAFTNHDPQSWVKNIWVFLLVGAAMMFTGTFNVYIQAWIAIRWRRWMTARYLSLWMENGQHYRMQLTGNETDNPDQRIAEDISAFIGSTWMYTFSLGQNLLSLGTYLVMLWGLSASIPLMLGGKDWSFPGYFIAIAIVWVTITTTLTHKVGKPLSRLTYNQQMYDANFRFSLVRVRECSEQIALLKGEEVEHTRLMTIFGDAVANIFRTMGRNMKLGIMTTALSYGDAMMFTLLLGPAYFYYDAIPGYGTFMQIATAFLNVANGFKWFQTQYVGLASFVAIIDRLYAFNNNYELTKKVADQSELKFSQSTKNEIDIRDLDVYLPNGKLQISAKEMTLRAGEKILIKGRTGAGKTTLFRAISGIWPFGKGSISLPKDKKIMVLPQRPYFPIGTLAEAICYPTPPGTYSREDVQKALSDVGLPQMVNRVDEVSHWNMVLSGGEQQRVGIARAMLFKPDYLFFDEATASMDEPSEDELYKMLLVKMKDTTIISIGHRSSLEQFHTRLIFAEGQPEGTYKFIEQVMNK